MANVQAQEGLAQVETVTVTANRSERALSDVAGTVSIIDQSVIEQNIARDIRDLIRYEPGITVSGGGRFGLNGFNIRGVGGDRVLTQIDGAPTSDEFSFGPFLSSRRDFVDVDSLKTVEVIRGPASSLYGADALGGVVSFLTKDPTDYLAESGSNRHLSVKGGYTSEDNSVMTNLTAAAGNDLVQGMLLYTFREGEETQNNSDGGPAQGAARTAPDPFDFETNNLLGKVLITPNEQHTFRLIGEVFESNSFSNVQSAANEVVRGVLTTNSVGDDARERMRFSVAHTFEGETALFSRSFAQLYLQDSEGRQLTLQDRLSRGAPQRRTRDSFFQQEVLGLELQFDKAITTGSIDHYLVYGVDFELTDSESLRTGGTVDALSGAPQFEFNPLPTRDFPLSEQTELAVYLQDELSLLDGRLLLTPSVRWDRFELDPDADPVYLAGNPGAPAVEPFEDDRVTFKLGAVYDLTSTYSVYGQYAQGFRAPPFDDVNVGFTNLQGGYITLPNSQLESETSDSFEVGLRGQGARGFFSLAAYINQYENFIESLATLGFNPVTGLIEFQATNRDQVEIRGIEFKGNFAVPRVNGLSAVTTVAYARGENEVSGQPLNTVDPLRAVVGLAYQPTSTWNAQLVMTAVAGQDRVDSTGAVNRFFEPGGYATVDLLGEYHFGEQARLNFGIFNLTDRQYWEWGDVVAREFDDPALARFTRPGINASVSLRYEL
jgi:hemoglobin/transferrin/lactoferrin receptor protein